MRNLTSIIVCCACVVGANTASAEKIGLPDTISIAGYSLGSGIYNVVVAISSAVKKQYGKNFRIIPANNDVSRMIMIRNKRAIVASMGAGVFFAQEGAFDFGGKKWGPQSVRIIALNLPKHSAGIFVSAKTNIKTMADLKGKRVPRVRNAPSLSELMRGYLAFGGLTWEDVKVVEVSGFRAMHAAFLQGQVDTAISATTSPQPLRANASSRGPIIWLPTPTSDKAGWARLKNIVPYLSPFTATSGAGVNKTKPLLGSRFPLPTIVAYPNLSDEYAYALAKMIQESYPRYKETTPMAHGFKTTKIHLETSYPYHPGAIKYYKEIGLWGADEEKLQVKNLYRQKVLKTAWEAHKKKSEKLNEAEYYTSWMLARADALKKAKLTTIWSQ